jgi:shikimate dehydrogenase
MKLYGLIGYPLSHSFSKKYFTEKFSRERIDGCRYELFPLEDISLFPELWEKNTDLLGVNVTIPYKEKVIPFLDSASDVVMKTGACNCIKKTDGLLKGFNTDVIGFEKVLLRNLKPNHKAALILGTGGAAKAVQYVLEQNNIEYLFVSRTGGKGLITYEDLNKEIITSHLLIINTTPLGMYPNTDVSPDIPYEFLLADHFLFDLIYNPSETLFLQKGASQGAFIQNGEDMLAIQAEESWRIWNTTGNV